MVKNTKKLKQTLLSIVIVGVVAVGTVFLFRAINHNSYNGATSNTNSPSTNPDYLNESHESSNTPNRRHEEEKTFYDEYDSNSGNNITGVRSYTGFQEDGSLLVNFALDQYLNTGTCKLTFGSATATSQVEASAATSYCSIRLDGSFSVGSSYEFTLEVNSGEKSGVISGEVTL